MTASAEHAALMRFLKATNDMYYGKALEVRQAIQGWLEYVPQTFGHYTAHTIQHSDEIISQISQLLFEQNDPGRAVVDLSGAEAYILVAAAYLHDAGMVVSDREKAEILASDSWRRWITEGGGERRWAEVQQRRNSGNPPDEPLRAFLADIQTRYLVAEFVRRTHHRRAGAIIAQHEATLGRFAFGDPVLQNTISAVCVSHGLTSRELEDQERYPERRTVRGDLVNVRFLAILLRLGDLLDTSYDRACPLLLSAASPLPADSLAHWTKYQRIVHRLTAPDRIELTAECETQDEHRFLQDWCQWLVEETREARKLMARASRHGSWEPPQTQLDANATILIKPASVATYIPSQWVFQLDHDLVFERLIRDVYDNPYAFVRELIQNALDASRCEMYANIIEEGLEPPQYPTQVDEGRRQRYPIRVSLRAEQALNQLSGEPEERQVLVVEDRGVGMDREIIEHFFLQVGRSYYTTEEFRRSYPFVPTSRFGVGFLSVFAVSDRVTVETYKPRSRRDDGPIRMVLTGPRNYLLTDRGERSVSGTRIEVWLREPMQPGRLTEAVSGWCKRVEFPIVLDDLGAPMVVTADQPRTASPTVPDVDEEGAYFTIRVFPVNRPGVEGELYVFAHVDARGESWGTRGWAYLAKHPLTALPEPPDQYVCLHGIRISCHIWPHSRLHPGTASMQLDVRREWPSVSLARAPLWPYSFQDVWAGWRDDLLALEVKAAWEEFLTQHLSTSARAQSASGWAYKQNLIEYFPFGTFWALQPEMIRLYEHGVPRVLGLRDAEAMPVLTTMAWFGDVPFGQSAPADEALALAGGLEHPAIIPDDLNAISDPHRRAIFERRRADRVRWLSKGYAAIDWLVDGLSWDPWSTVAQPWPQLQSASLPDRAAVAVRIHKTIDDVYESVLINSDHPFCGWLGRVAEATKEGRYGMDEQRIWRLAYALREAAFYRKFGELKAWLDAWRQVEGLPPELQPPEIEITPRAFRMQREEGNESELGA